MKLGDLFKVLILFLCAGLIYSCASAPASSSKGGGGSPGGGNSNPPSAQGSIQNLPSMQPDVPASLKLKLKLKLKDSSSARFAGKSPRRAFGDLVNLNPIDLPDVTAQGWYDVIASISATNEAAKWLSRLKTFAATNTNALVTNTVISLGSMMDDWGDTLDFGQMIVQ